MDRNLINVAIYDFSFPVLWEFGNTWILRHGAIDEVVTEMVDYVRKSSMTIQELVKDSKNSRISNVKYLGPSRSYRCYPVDLPRPGDKEKSTKSSSSSSSLLSQCFYQEMTGAK